MSKVDLPPWAETSALLTYPQFIHRHLHLRYVTPLNCSMVATLSSVLRDMLTLPNSPSYVSQTVSLDYQGSLQRGRTVWRYPEALQYRGQDATAVLSNTCCITRQSGQDWTACGSSRGGAGIVASHDVNNQLITVHRRLPRDLERSRLCCVCLGKVAVAAAMFTLSCIGI